MEYRAGDIVFNDWVITKEIGRGATGRVFEIQKRSANTEIRSALKVIQIPRSQADIRAAMAEGMSQVSVTSYFRGFVDEILGEIDTMVLLKEHPNIVSYEDHCVVEHVGEIGWDILIKMELLIPMVEWVLVNPMNEAVVLRCGREISSALGFAAAHNLVHRDVKPGNIFVDSMDNFKLGDFGIARVIDKTTGGISKKGTESYMPPEVYQGRADKRYMQQIDIYSLGMVLYRLMNQNRLPFYPPAPEPISYTDVENALIQRMEGTPLPPPCMGSQAMKNVILKACAYDPKDRFRSMAEMYDALKAVSISGNGEYTPPKSQPVPAHGKKSAGKKTTAVVAAVGVIIVAGLGAGVILPKFHSSDDKGNTEVVVTETPEETETSKVTEVPKETETSEQPAGEKKTDDHTVYTSKHMWEQNGTIYTVNDVRMQGFHSVSGNYLDTMILYDNKIYLKRSQEEGSPLAQIIRMDLAGNNQEILTNNMQGNAKMCIYNGYLYYTHRDEDGNKAGWRQNLETGEEEEMGPYIFRAGNDHLWISTNLEENTWSISEPAYENIKKTDKIKGSMLGINDDKVYYMYKEDDDTYTTCSYNAKTDKSSKIIMGMPAKSTLAGDGLYYKSVSDGRTTLYRWDLNDKDKKESFDLGEFNLYMGGGFNEVGDRTFFVKFVPDNGQSNTELWELTRSSGKIERIATWYNANAEAASKEP